MPILQSEYPSDPPLLTAVVETLSSNRVVGFRMTATSGVTSPRVRIDWGDGTIEHIPFSVGVSEQITHTYVSAGEYDIMVQEDNGRCISTLDFQVFGDKKGNDFLWRVLKINAPRLNSGYIDLYNTGTPLDAASGIREAWLYDFGTAPMLSSAFMRNTQIDGVDVHLFGTTVKATTAAYMFRESNIVNPPSFDTSSIVSLTQMFYGCSSLLTGPTFDLRNAENCSYMFHSCTNLVNSPVLYNTSKVTNVANMFYQCSSLVEVVPFDTSNVTDFSYMFNSCTVLEDASFIDTSNAVNVSYMFQYCNALTSVPAVMNTGNSPSLDSLFHSCHSLAEFPESIDASSATSMYSTFRECYLMETVPELLNTGNVQSFDSTFTNASLITEIPWFDASSATTFAQMCHGCSALEYFPDVDVSNVTNFGTMFVACPNLSACDMYGGRYAISYNNCNLDRNAIVNIFNNLGTANGAQTITVTSNPGSASLTAGDKKIAEDKGWTVSA